MSALPSKICGICGEDCAGRPRTKDPQGRYFCQSCYDEALERKRQGVAPPAKHPLPNVGATVIDPGVSNDELFADAIEAPPVETMSPCPSCGAGLPVGAALCVSCGYSPQTGGKFSTKKMKAPREKRSIGISPGMVGLGAFVLTIIGFALCFVSPIMALLLLVGASLTYSIMSIVVLIFAFMESILDGILTLFIPFYIFYFVLAKLENEYIKNVWAVSVFAFIVSIVAVAIQAPDQLQQIMNEAQQNNPPPWQ